MVTLFSDKNGTLCYPHPFNRLRKSYAGTSALHWFPYLSGITRAYLAGCSKSPSSKAATREDAKHTLRYVEGLSDARTTLASFFSIHPNEASDLCQELVMHPPFNVSVLHQFHLVPSIALFQEHHLGSPLQRVSNRGELYTRATSNIQRGSRHFIAFPFFLFATQYRGTHAPKEMPGLDPASTRERYLHAPPHP